MKHVFFIQQFDLSFLKVSKSVYLSYLKRCRENSSLNCEIRYCFTPVIPGLLNKPDRLHFLCIKQSWL